MPWTATEKTEFQRRVTVANSHFERFRTSSLHALMTLLNTVPLPSADAVRAGIAAIPANKKDAKYRSAIDYLRINYPGVDEVTVGGYTYKGFAGVQDEKSRMARAQLGFSRFY